MQKPLWISDRWIRWVMRLLVSSIVALAVAITVFIAGSYRREHTTKVANLEIRGVVTKIIQQSSPDTKRCVARLSVGGALCWKTRCAACCKWATRFLKSGEPLIIFGSRKEERQKSVYWFIGPENFGRLENLKSTSTQAATTVLSYVSGGLQKRLAEAKREVNSAFKRSCCNTFPGFRGVCPVLK